MHKARAFFFVAAGMFLLALVYHFGARSATAQASASGSIGRYTIVNGTPEAARYIMLLDTTTGSSWVACEGELGGVNWCRMQRSEDPSSKPREGK